MSSPPTGGATGLVIVVVLGVVIGSVACLVERRFGFNLADAGALWYGVEQVRDGQVPIRDFASYDPLRYYWAAAWLQLFHARGITAVRTATWAFATLGIVFAGLLTWWARPRSGLSYLWSILIMLLCTLWMIPWWKQYDAAISIILIASLAVVLSKPTTARFFLHGFVVGVAALVGQNHGVYGIVASVLAVPLLAFGQDRIRWLHCTRAWAGGVVCGFLPMLVAIGVSSGFAARLLEDVRLYIELKSTNVYLPIPWPWTITITDQPLRIAALKLLIGCFFVLLPIFCIAGAVYLIRNKYKHHGRLTDPVFAACVAVAIPYLNVAFSRADISHLAQASMPCLIGITMLVSRVRASRRLIVSAVTLVLAVTSAYVTLPFHSVYQKYVDGGWTKVDLAHDTVWMASTTAANVAMFKALSERYAPGKAPILVVPFFPGVYALLHKRSPTYEIYPLVLRTRRFQDGEIAQLRASCPRLIVIDDAGLDGREDLQYSNTHRYIWRYVNASYRGIAGPARAPSLHVYVPPKRDGSCNNTGL